MAKRRFLVKAAAFRIVSGMYCIVALATMFFGGGGAEAGATPADIAALLEFKAAIVDDEGYLRNWVNGTDPCVDAWPGVWCDCGAAEKKTGVDLECGGLGGAGQQQDHQIVALKPKCESCRWLRFKGKIAPELANITTLRLLDLSEHSFEGDVPTQLQELKELRFLSLRDNRLNGTLPNFFGKLSKLKTLELDRNDFSGPIPDQWCTDGFNSTKVTLQNNPLLCGKVPPCIKNPRIEFTHLGGTGNAQGGICDSTPPVCPQKNGCGIFVPQYWTHPDTISFGFDEFKDPESSMSGYTFSVALDSGNQTPEQVVFNMKVETSANLEVEVVKSEHQGAEGQHKHYKVKHFLTGVVLVSGARYVVSVTATNRGIPPLSTTIVSTPVIVDLTGPSGGSTVFNRVPINSENSHEAGHLGVSWIPFVDIESNVTSVTVQLVEVDDSGNSMKNITDRIDVPQNRNTLDVNAELEEDTLYQFEVMAINDAGISTTRSSHPFLVSTPKQFSGRHDMSKFQLMFIICGLAVATMFFAIGVGVIVWKRGWINELSTHAHLQRKAENSGHTCSPRTTISMRRTV